jgi:hypothetical protein
MEKYIWWALDEHLLNATTYVQESEETAQTKANDLFTEIYQWMQKHYRMCEYLTKDATDYIWYWIITEPEKVGIKLE